ncbi:hypothetical protein [Clostridium tertium]|uniref:hypothetical protein n=1 Tax=Clostridium tertium TaxID=1559 RepID=UPI0018A8C41C|nr:hypothetical protein [Clostridium tertium]
MINENNELIITTAEGFEIIRIINKMGMKDNLISLIDVSTNNAQRNQNETLKLQSLIIEKVGGKENYLNLSDEEKAQISDEVLIDHEEIRSNLIDIKSSTMKLGADLLFDFISKMPLAEKEINRTIAKIFNKQVKEIENQSLEETISMLKKIVKSKTFNNLICFFK